MKITITHHYNIYTLIWSIGKERKTYIQKNNCCIWAQRSDNWIDMYWIQQLLLFVTCIYLYFTCILPVFTCIVSCAWETCCIVYPSVLCLGGRSLLPPCQTCPSIIWWHFVFFKLASKEIRWSHIVKGNHGNRWKQKRNAFIVG